MGKFKVGDKVKVINVNGIVFGERHYYDGFVTEVVKTEVFGVYLKNKEGDEGVYIDESEYDCIELVDSKITKKQQIQALEKRVEALEKRVEALEKLVEDYFKLPVEPSTDDVEVIEFEGAKYRKVERLAREGDVVIFRSENIPNLCLLKKGKPYRVVPFMNKICAEHDEWTHYEVYVQNAMSFRTPETVDVYELIPSFTTYEGQDLEAEYAEQVKVEKTPNQLRAEIIEKAKGFVVKHRKERHSTIGAKGYPYEGETMHFTDVYIVPAKKCIYDKKYNGVTKAEFIINAEKRTIVALMRGVKTNILIGKGIAKCNPSDVFNEHIGKAIALGRALGLDVSEFEGAVQPTKVVVGMRTYHEHSHDYWDITTDNIRYVHGPNTIINDTQAIYGEVE